jgi:hypothetical protein
MRRTIYHICLALLLGTLLLPEVTAHAPKKRCQLHGNILKRDVVPVRVTFLDGTIWQEDEKKYFPNANPVVWVGDYPAPAANEVREVWYCEKCRAVRKRWCKTHECISLTSEALPNRT